MVGYDGKNPVMACKIYAGMILSIGLLSIGYNSALPNYETMPESIKKSIQIEENKLENKINKFHNLLKKKEEIAKQDDYVITKRNEVLTEKICKEGIEIYEISQSLKKISNKKINFGNFLYRSSCKQVGLDW